MWSTTSTKRSSVALLGDYDGLPRQLICAVTIVAHLSVTSLLFYDIIFTSNENRYDVLMNKIQNGLTAAVSFVSLCFTVWYYDVICNTFGNLYKLDCTMESIGIKRETLKGRPTLATTTTKMATSSTTAKMTQGMVMATSTITTATTTTTTTATSEQKDRYFSFSNRTIEIGLGFIMMSTYFCTKYLRYRYLTSHDILTSLRHSFVRTCCISLGEFVLITFIKSMDEGRKRFATLNRWINQEIDDGKLILNSRESDDINDIYFEIMNFCDLILACYQIQIFLTLISDIVVVIYMVLTAFNEFVSGSVALVAIMFCVVDPLIRLTQTVRVMSTATATISEAQNMANCLQRLLIETSMNIMTREKINLFLLELVDKKLQFVVCGFLSLNNETLVVMTGTVSTYLLIMMQFQPPVD